MADKQKLGKLFEDLVKQTQIDRAELQKIWNECVAQAKSEGKNEEHPHFYPYVMAQLRIKANLTIEKCEALLAQAQPTLPVHIDNSMLNCAQRYMQHDARDKEPRLGKISLQKR